MKSYQRNSGGSRLVGVKIDVLFFSTHLHTRGFEFVPVFVTIFSLHSKKYKSLTFCVPLRAWRVVLVLFFYVSIYFALGVRPPMYYFAFSFKIMKAWRMCVYH